ncbi:STAS domain-containing protein [Carnobacterium divergens]|uniref:STAS domain-containing protein n=1 Tax=Carnobacterium divergens TaxID=2748 RepID=UPI0034CDA37A
MAKLANISITQEDNVFVVRGPLFFASTHDFLHYFESRDYDNETLIINLSDSHILDHSGIEALKTLIINTKKQNRKIAIIGLEIHNPELRNEMDLLLSE